MAIFFKVGGSSTVVPGVYSTFSVASSILSPAAAGRSLLLIGEASEGAPGADLDITRNFFTSFDDVKEVYTSGPIVDGARQFFSTQPSATGQIFRAYVYKTNASTRAEKTIALPSNFGKLVSVLYGERGNYVKTQILDAQSETKPSVSFSYLPSPAARNLKVVVNGQPSAALAQAADDVASDLATDLGAVTGLSTTGGTARTTISAGPMTADLSASGNTLTITRASGAATFDTSSIAVNDICYIPDGSALAGAGDANSGVYLVTSVTSTSLALYQLKSTSGAAEVNSVAFDAATGISIAAADLKINAPLTISVSASTPTGAGASLELLESTANKLGLGLLAQPGNFNTILIDSTSSIASISATAPSAGKLTISLSSGSWTQIPKAGDLIKIDRGSLLAGSTLLNVGMLAVESASAQSITCSHLFSGMTTEAVASVALNGANSVLKYAAGFVTSSLAYKLSTSAAERKVKLEAVRTTDGVTAPATSIGGNVCLELSYYNAAATAATVSIDSNRLMTIDLTGTGLSDITVNTKKYPTLQDLVNFLNTQSGLSAKVSNNLFKSLPSSSLDMVSAVNILSGSSVAAYNGRIKKDYADWLTYFEDNTGLIDFVAGGMSLKAGLPDSEASASYLAGGAVGATNNASIQSALDAGLQIAVRYVVPAFSRDAYKDIADGLTDSASSYTIDSIHAATQGHVSTASNDINRKYRFGSVSFDGSFEDAKEKSAGLGYKRLQMFFQRVGATDGDGNLVTMLPWEAACAVAAGRLQSPLGTSMLRKSFLLSSVEHIGDKSLYDDTLTQDFNPADRGQLEEAIIAGLAVLQALPGFGVAMVSPDLSTESKTNSPTAWVNERINVLFTCDEVRDVVQSVLENFIGNRTSDVSEALIRSAINDVLATFVIGSGDGSLLAAKVLDVKILGNQAKAKISIKPAEALEAIVLDVLADRNLV
jgi:hypothetical protein